MENYTDVGIKYDKENLIKKLTEIQPEISSDKIESAVEGIIEVMKNNHLTYYQALHILDITRNALKVMSQSIEM